MYNDGDGGRASLPTLDETRTAKCYSDTIMDIVKDIRGDLSELDSKIRQLSGGEENMIEPDEKEPEPFNYSEALVLELRRLKMKSSGVVHNLGKFL